MINSPKKALAAAATALMVSAGAANATTVSYDAPISFNNHTTGVLTDSSFAVGETVESAFDFNTGILTLTSDTAETFDATFSVGSQINDVNSAFFGLISGYTFNVNGNPGFGIFDGDLNGGPFTLDEFFTSLQTGNNTVISANNIDTNGSFISVSADRAGFNATVTHTEMAPVPLPAGVILLVGALGALGAMRLRSLKNN